MNREKNVNNTKKATSNKTPATMFLPARNAEGLYFLNLRALIIETTVRTALRVSILITSQEIA